MTPDDEILLKLLESYATFEQSMDRAQEIGINLSGLFENIDLLDIVFDLVGFPAEAEGVFCRDWLYNEWAEVCDEVAALPEFIQWLRSELKQWLLNEAERANENNPNSEAKH